MQPSLFKYSAQNTITLFVLIALSIAIMTIDQRFHYLENVRSTLSHLLYPARYLVNLPSEVADWGTETLASRTKLLEENRILKESNLKLSSQLLKFSVLEQENNRLRSLFNSAKKIKDRVLIAELLSVDLDPFRQHIMINKGEKNDVYIGQPVIDALGVMGQIIHTDPYSATTLLISDPSHALPVKISRNGLRTIASGTGNPNNLKLLYIPENSDLKIGDHVVTSGLGERFPANYPVAQITQITHSPGKSFSEVLAKPTAQLDKSQEVLLVWKSEQRKKIDE